MKKTLLLGTSYPFTVAVSQLEAHPAECAGSQLLFECAKIKAQNACYKLKIFKAMAL